MAMGRRRPRCRRTGPASVCLVWVLGTWQPAVVIGSTGSGHVLARYRRLDGELGERAFPPSSVVDATAM